MNEGRGGVAWWGGLGLRCCGGVWWDGDGASRLKVSPLQASEATLRQPRADLSILINCAKMAEETLDDESVLSISFTMEKVQTCIKDVKTWTRDFAKSLEQRG